MGFPFFSIIVPVYNVEQYLRECLDSIISQSFQDFELILINDGSQDSSLSICIEYAKKYDNIIFLDQINSGVSTARNHGLQMASGKYIWFIDGDDYIDLNSLAIIHKKIVEAGDLDMLGFSYKTLSENNVEIRNKDEILNPISGGEYIKHNYRMALWTYLYKRDILIENKIKFIPGISYFEDNLFNIETLNNVERIIQLDIPIYTYRIANSNSAMNNIKLYQMLSSLIQIINRIKNLKSKNISFKQFEFCSVSFFDNFNYYAYSTNLNFKDRKKLLLICDFDFLLNDTKQEYHTIFDINLFNLFGKFFFYLVNTRLISILRKVYVKIKKYI